MEKDTAAADLAFLRNLVQAGDDGQRSFGVSYFWAGLIYGVQMLLHGAQFLGFFDGPVYGLLIGLGPTVVFIAMMIWLSIRNRGRPTAGVAGRAVGAVFAATGLANIVLIVVIGLSAAREKSLEIWLIYPCVVMALQGAAWMVAWQIRRQRMAAIVAAGWFVVALAMGYFIGNPVGYVISSGIGLFAFMLIPGWIMMRNASKAA